MLGKAFNDGGFAFFDKVDDLFWGEFFAHHDIWQDKIAAALASLKIVTPLGTNVTFNNPPDGNNNSPSVVVIKVNGRGTYDVVA